MDMAPVASSGPGVLANGNQDGTSTSWLEANWMFLSWAFALFGLGVLVTKPFLRDPYWQGWLAFVAYCLHQSEEHAYDLRGWRYAFVPSMNDGFGKALFASACPGVAVGCPLDPKLTLYINAVAIWFGFGGCMLLATVYPERFLFAGCLNWGTAVVNGLAGHLVTAVVHRQYNPGCVQSAIMVPLGLYIIWGSARPWLCLANGLLFHVVAFGVGINVILRAHAPEEAAIVFTAVAALAIPLTISWFSAQTSAYLAMKVAL